MKKETSPANIALSENLQRLLKNENWTTVARKIGMNRSTLYNWTYGVAPSSLKSLVKLSDYFGVSLDELCLYSDEVEHQGEPIMVSFLITNFKTKP